MSKEKKYLPIIGLEIHAELKTASKMFCRCANGYELQDSPNKVICEICLGHPGTLPVINQQAVDWTILTALALHQTINPEPKFSRKNYFYPDLPKGYQITSQPDPIGFGGYIKLKNGLPITIDHLHLEEDTGTLKHPQNTNYSLADYSRSSTPLMELVTEPVITSAVDAKEFCQEFQKILRYLEISDANMEQGQMRCEANISLQEAGQFEVKDGKIITQPGYELNPKTEVKNINSFKALERAIEYELIRQAKALNEGEPLKQETRGWDDVKQITFSQRSKEAAHDYRYFPEPDLPPLKITEQQISTLKSTLPELPENKFYRFQAEYGFNASEAAILTDDKHLSAYTEKTISELQAWLTSLETVSGSQQEIWETNKAKLAKLVSNWLINKLFKLLNEKQLKVQANKITPENFAEFITLIYQNKINSAAAQTILEKMFTTGADPEHILADQDLNQVSDSTELTEIVNKIIAANPGPTNDYKNGKLVAIKFLLGCAMKETKGKANPQVLEELFLQQLTK
ncbi:MAG: Asp-tRNA(Asn)/Glu-tRNA(Gln) amidotransferase subunit GatB [Candidatus Buchananbacteria bacterium]